MKTVFMGTPDFALAILSEICVKIGPPELVVTQPDRPKGRGKELAPPPVKTFALERGIPVLQPNRLAEITDRLRDSVPDFIVVAAFGQLLKPAVLEIPSRACVNVHASLLPQYRGASPINAAVIDGREETGVTTMLMDAGMDTGDMLLTHEEKIYPEDTAETLQCRLAEAGAALCIETLLNFDSITPVRQDGSLATYSAKLTKETGRIDWSRPAVDIRNLIRGCTPWPGTFTFMAGRMIKIWKAEVAPGPPPPGIPPGFVLKADAAGILTTAGRDCLLVTELQSEGKKRQPADSFLRGCHVGKGDTFTSHA